MMNQPTTITLEEVKKEIMFMIRKEMEIIAKNERGDALCPHIISKLSIVLQKMGVLCFECRFCNTLFPNDVLWKIKGKPLCSTCRDFVVGDKSKVKYT